MEVYKNKNLYHSKSMGGFCNTWKPVIMLALFQSLTWVPYESLVLTNFVQSKADLGVTTLPPIL